MKKEIAGSLLTGSLLMIIVGGCTSMDVRPIPAAVQLDRICIKFNEEVNVEDFVPAVQEDFADHGITSVVFKAEKPANCGFTMTYTVDRWWDLAPYMTDARMIVNKDDAFVGSAHYHLVNHGGLSLAKWEGTHSKIDPVVEKLLTNYTKTDLAASIKTASK